MNKQHLVLSNSPFALHVAVVEPDVNVKPVAQKTSQEEP